MHHVCPVKKEHLEKERLLDYPSLRLALGFDVKKIRAEQNSIPIQKMCKQHCDHCSMISKALGGCP